MGGGGRIRLWNNGSIHKMDHDIQNTNDKHGGILTLLKMSLVAVTTHISSINFLSSLPSIHTALKTLVIGILRVYDLSLSQQTCR